MSTVKMYRSALLDLALMAAMALCALFFGEVSGLFWFLSGAACMTAAVDFGNARRTARRLGGGR
jgi:hypothetical protein